MAKHGFIAPIAILLFMLLAACTETQFVGYQKEETAPDLFSRQVEFKVSKAFYRDPPECVVVLPFVATDKEKGEGLERVVEDALARQLSSKVARVIGLAERDHLVRRLAVDLSLPGDRALLAKQVRCRFFVQARTWGGESTNAVVWTQTRVGLEVVMMRARDDNVVWQARHEATRSGGGLPVSILGLSLAIFNATRHREDRDIIPSMIEDVIRRMAVTLPNVRFVGSRRAAVSN